MRVKYTCFNRTVQRDMASGCKHTHLQWIMVPTLGEMIMCPECQSPAVAPHDLMRLDLIELGQRFSE